MEFLAYFRAVRRHWLIILACVLVGAGLGVASTQIESTTPVKARTYHKATHTLFFDSSGASSGAFASAFTNLDQMAVLTTTGPVPNAAAAALHSDESGHQLAEQITTLSNPTTSTLEITAIDKDGDRAVELADAFAKALVANLTAKDVDRYNQANTSAKTRLDDLQKQIDSLIAQIAANPANVDVLKAQLLSANNRYSQAYSDFQDIGSTAPPTSALSTLEAAEAVPIGEAEYQTRLSKGQLGQNNLQVGTEAADTAATGGVTGSSAFEGPVSRGVLGGFLGLLAGFGLALLAERLDRRIRTRQAAEEAFRLPVLAEVPKLDAKEQGAFGIAAHDAPMSAAAEAFRAIRSALLFQHAVGTAATSANGDGPSGGRAAVSFEGEPVGPIIVMVASASPREGKTTTAANLAAVFAETGSSVLVVNCDFRRPMVHRYLGVQDIPRRVIATRVPGVKAVTNVLDDPDANPARVLAEQRRLINAARGQFDVMILDTAPLLSANDAIELVGGADLVLMVARAGQSTIHEAALSIEMLERVHAPVAGLVLMGTTDSPNSYYNSYRSEPPKPAKAKPKAERRRGKDRRAAASVSTNGAGSGDAATSAAPAADPHA